MGGLTMAWLGAFSRHDGWFKPDLCANVVSLAEDGETQLLARGTLLVEARISPEDRPQTLLTCNRSFPSPGSISLQVLPGGSVVFIEEQDGETSSAVLPCPYRERMDVVRVSYSWDAVTGAARLAIERPEPDSLHMIDINHARPMVLNDLRAMMQQPALRNIDNDVLQIALSSRVEPVGACLGFTAHTPIMTQFGERSVRDIKRGDLVLTDQGTYVPVLNVVRRVLPAMGGFRPIRLRAGYFGLTRNIVIAPDQRIVMQGSDVEYLFGREAVTVPARALLNDTWAVQAEGPDTVAYYQLLLPGHEVVMASGCPVESLYVGRLRRNPEKLRASVLAGLDRSRLPEHPKPVCPALRPFEAITLATTRAA